MHTDAPITPASARFERQTFLQLGLIALLGAGISAAAFSGWYRGSVDGWVVFLVLGAFLSGLLGYGCERTRRQRVMERLEEVLARPRVPIEEHVSALIQSYALPESARPALAAAWERAALAVMAEPEVLRPDDDVLMWRSLRPIGIGAPDPLRHASDQEWRSMEAARATFSAGGASPLCSVCGYSSKGLPRMSPCPECGELARMTVKTIGDHVVFLAHG
jgi:hypothetical protein